MKIAAVLWDYDGTIADSTRKNMAVNEEIFRHFYPGEEVMLPKVFESVSSYKKADKSCKNWRELYENIFGYTREQADEAGRLWTSYQMKNETAPELFDGMKEVFLSLEGMKMGICSQNGAENIRNMLEYHGISQCVQTVIGHESIPFTCQKPAPEGFLKCLAKLAVTGEEGELVYIGDHREDMVFAKNGEESLKALGIQTKVWKIAVQYEKDETKYWTVQPDYVAGTPAEILEALEEIGRKNS